MYIVNVLPYERNIVNIRALDISRFWALQYVYVDAILLLTYYHIYVRSEK